MRKVLTLILLIVYTGLVSGVNVRLHYCGGKLKSVSLLAGESEKGCCGNKMKSKDCCKNKHSFVKVKDSHQINSGVKFNTTKVVSLDFAVCNINTATQHHLIQSHLIADCNAPPALNNTPLYLKNRVLII